MNSLYIHIPFCLRKCKYCDFVSYDSFDSHIKDVYAKATADEIGLIPAGDFDTVFFGGGTPTTLSTQAMREIVNAVAYHGITKDCEITVEANPETVTAKYAKELKAMGINRISMGLQSARDRLLKEIGRVHSYDRFLYAYDCLRNAGFENINIDIMYGLPGQKRVDFKDTIERVVRLRPEHISAYALTLAEGTPMYEAVISGKVCVPEAEDMEEPLKLLNSIYHRYEVSNYAMENRECRHNINYWKNGYYFGVGCGAHGCISVDTAKKLGCKCVDCVSVRTENTSVLKDYLNGERPALTFISIEESMFETVMLGLRMIKGVSEDEFFKRYGYRLYDLIGGYAEKHGELIRRQDGYVFLTEKGMDIQNRVLVELMDCF